jgi:hypothetical protein
MGILEIGLTVWAWNRGWKTWALLPSGIGLCLSILIALILHDAGALKIYVSSIGAFIFIDVVAVAALIFMVIQPKRITDIDGGRKTADSVQSHEASNKNVTVSLSPAKAKLITRDNKEVSISESIRPIGRADFQGLIPSSELRYISSQHFWIRTDKGKYFIEDYQSTNGTRLNRVDIKGTGLHSIKNGDKIDIAGILVVNFKVSKLP